MWKSENPFVKNKTLIIIFTVLFLTMFRIAWVLFFTLSDKPDAIGGELDLRNWNPKEKETITLDGDWEFYPYSFLVNDEEIIVEKELLQVPGSWNKALQADGESSFGYGTYRLRILVEPKDEINYSIRVPSIRSASALYVNGQMLKKSGQPAKNNADYIAKNIPYTATFNAQGLDELEIVIHVANYKDIRKSGIIRSMRIGTEEAMSRETTLSTTMQLLVLFAFFIHAVYAIILYFLGERNRKWLYFSLLIFSIIVFISLSNDDKVLLSLLPINYDWSFKLTPLSLMTASFALIMAISSEIRAARRRKIILFSSLTYGFFLLALLLTPSENIFLVANSSFFISTIAILFAAFVMLPKALKKAKKHLFITISLLAFTNDLVWTNIFRFVGIKTLYYPFDLVIAIIAFSAIWLNQYFQNYHKMKDLTVKLQRIDSRKDEFLANTSHELKNPLHGIITLTQTVLEREESTLAPKSRQDLDSVIAVGKRMSYMLNDLLDFMHLKESDILLHKSAVDLRNTASGVINMIQSMTKSKAIQIENRIPKSFPLVYGDEYRLIQILFNLLHNAVKFTIRGKVYIRAEVRDGQAYISVHDTGIGMSTELIERIFEPYEQAPFNEISIEGGFGLGLSICQQLVNLHGSKLEVQSTVGKGSVFTFNLELSDAQDQQRAGIGMELSQEIATAEPIAELNNVAEKVDSNRPKILAVDDDPLNLKILKNILPAKEYDVVTVTSAEEALELIHKEQWHLLITDVVMPNMSGYELTIKVRERFSLVDLPIILLTSRVSSENIEYGFLIGTNDYVTKPIDIKVLRSRVKALTDLQLSISERLRIEGALLQAQIKPHFLFNTLNSIAALSQMDSERMLNLLNEFSNYLRASFDFQNLEKLVPIEHELNLVRSYLYIEKERFSQRLMIHFDVDEQIDFFIPPLTIQPLVENAIRHGILKKQNGGTLTIRITEQPTSYTIWIEDDGIGMSNDLLESLRENRYREGAGIGIINTNKRLIKQFGHGLEIRSKLGEGTTISFKIDKQEKK